MFRVIRWGLVSGLAILSCVRCGVPICAFGAGDCAKMYANAPGGGTVNQSANPVVVTPAGNINTQAIAVGQSFTITATGGTPCSGANPYKFNYEATDGLTHQQITPTAKGTYTFADIGSFMVYADDCSGQRGKLPVTVK